MNSYRIIKKWRDAKTSRCSAAMRAFFVSFFKTEGVTKYGDDAVPAPFFVYSSNVDGLFGKAGISSSEILEIHGNANVMQCADGVNCKGKDAASHRYWSASLPDAVNSAEDLPHCPCCHKVCRPSVLMFDDEEWIGLEGEGTSDFELYDVWEEGVEAFMKENEDASIVILEVGCGDNVPVVKMESETVLGDITSVITEEGTKGLDRVASRVSLIRVNVKKSKYLDYHKEWSEGKSFIDKDSIVCLEGPCGEVLERLDGLMWGVCC